MAPIARNGGLSTLSFSNNPAVASTDTYVMGFSPAEQVRTLVEHALVEGKTRFAVLAPQGPYGQLVVRALRETVQEYQATLVSTRFVDGNSPDFSEAIIDISNFNQRKKAGAGEGNLKARNDATSAAALRRLEELDTLGDPPFDAILLPMTSETALRTAAAQLAYYDVDQPAVRVLGLQIWEEFPRLTTEPSLVGSWYPAPDGSQMARFRQRYQSLSNAPSHRLARL